MYYVSKRMEIAVAHQLNLDYDSPCTNLHGHNLIVVVHIRGDHLNHNGMLMDFKKIKEEVHDLFDHHYLNDLLPKGLNPTAENLAKFICDSIKLEDGIECFRVDVQESEGNKATYEVE